MCQYGIEDCAEASMKGVEDNYKKFRERLIVLAGNSIGKIRPNWKKLQKYQTKIGRKQTYQYFKWQFWVIAHWNTQTCLRNEILKKETESFQIATQNNSIRENCRLRNITASVDFEKKNG